MGGAHTTSWTRPNGVVTLVEYANELAEINGSSTLSISIRAFNLEDSLIKSSDFGESEILLIDTKVYRNKIQNDSISISEKFDTDLIGFDALIYLKNRERASKNIIYESEGNFESNFIKSLLPLVVLSLILIIALVSLTIKIFKTKEKKIRLNLVIFVIGIVVILSIFSIQILWIMDYPNHTTAIMLGTNSIWLYILLFLISLYLIYTAIIGSKKYVWPKRFKIGYIIYALSFMSLSYLLYYWNIGGMLT